MTAFGSPVLWEEVRDDLKKPALSLSGGPQQRLCIARALAVDPEILLMGEPTSALDPISTNRIEDLVTDLKSRYTIVIITHNLGQAMRISDYAAFFLRAAASAESTAEALSRSVRRAGLSMGLRYQDSSHQKLSASINC